LLIVVFFLHLCGPSNYFII